MDRLEPKDVPAMTRGLNNLMINTLSDAPKTRGICSINIEEGD